MANVVSSLTLPNGLGTVLLYDGADSEFRNGKNLALRNTQNIEVWRIAPIGATGDDWFVHVECDESGGILANTWSGYLISIDVVSGSITTLAFTK